MEDDKIGSVLDKVEKLLRLAAVNPNESEAAAAAAKAQDLLAAYNLDMSAVEERGSDGKRLKEEFEGGRHEWQQDLWRAVARLNFCLYFAQTLFVESPLGKSRDIVTDENGRKRFATGVYQYRHTVVGKKVNVIATRTMATYLEGVCDRIVKERVRDNNERPNGRWANSFRSGITEKVVLKIYERRRELISAEEAKIFEAQKRAAEARAGSLSDSTALTISTYTAQEHDANIDFFHGEGTSAKWAAERAAQAAADRAADEAYTQWAAAHPKEAAKEEARRKREEERDHQRHSKQFFKGRNVGAWAEGWKRGDDVSLNQQAEGTKVAGLLK